MEKSGLQKRLESATRKALYDYQMVEGVDRVSVALSGGKDSITLLHLLHTISGRGFAPFELVAIHVSGEFSCGAGVQLDFLERTCASLNVPLIIRKSTQTLEKLECYSCSRERRSLLFEAAKEANAPTIAFGHHRDDSAQTLLMNLLHKGEFAAILPVVPMHAYGIRLIRPLILLEEEEIRRFALQEGFARITCQCPVGQRSKRQDTKNLLAHMEELFPYASANLARAGLLYGSDKATRVSTPPMG
ncbi:MAG: tRNA 2-thiocytidine biosynthesis protein TtcA [Verrucomicrobia bacterium]|nr:tRNA 2-thiocytidine biosynthesis protein TtcA [Verrucomicrobiota bacterium]